MQDRLSALKDVIERGIARTEPHVGAVGGNTIFTGSFDWHSCVHAHWALVEIGRLETAARRGAGKGRRRTGRRPGGLLTSRLTARNIRKEIAYLEAEPEFEKPYGRAWLLLLLEALSRDALRASCDGLWRDLLEWLERAPFPEKETGFDGAHKSWLFCFFLLVLASRRREDKAPDLLELRRRKLEPARRRILANARAGAGAPRDFIDLPSLLATVDALQGHALEQRHRALLAQRKDDLLGRDLRIADRAQSHAPGRYAMQAWPFMFHDPAAAGAITAKVLREKSCWAGRFAWVGHWVPQYLVMTAVLERCARAAGERTKEASCV